MSDFFMSKVEVDAVKIVGSASVIVRHGLHGDPFGSPRLPAYELNLTGRCILNDFTMELGDGRKFRIPQLAVSKIIIEGELLPTIDDNLDNIVFVMSPKDEEGSR